MTEHIEYVVKKLSPQQMLRFECKIDTVIKLIDGSAELFATELSTKGDLKLSKGYRGSILTFNGCTLQYTKDSLLEFTMGFNEDQELPNIYLNIHACLETSRNNEGNDVRGPRLMVCGHESVGKTTLCRILVNYAARKYRKVMLIDANVGLNDVSVPGSISTTIVSKPYDVSDGWDIFEDPLIYSFGHLSPVNNLKLFSLQLNNLAELVNVRSENDPDVFSGGCIINIAGVNNQSRDQGIEAIKAAIQAFEVNVLLIIEDGLIEGLIRKDLPDYVTVIRIPKSNGVHTRTNEQWEKERTSSLYSYFHGRGCHKLQPHKITLSSENYQIYKIACQETSTSLLPDGDNVEDECNQIKTVQFNKHLKNRLLAVSEATVEEDILGTPVYGFVVVLSVASDESSITVLSPSNEEPPSNILLWTDIQYVDM